MRALDPRGELVMVIEMPGAFWFGGELYDRSRPHVIVCADSARYVVPLSSFRQTFIELRDDIDMLVAMMSESEARR